MKKNILSAVVMAMTCIVAHAQTQNPEATGTGTQDATTTANDVNDQQLNQELSILVDNIQRTTSQVETLNSFNSRLNRIEEALVSGVPSSYNHKYVDLGVIVDGKPVYWATTNIGAKLPADYGLYFAWGETEGYTEDTNDGRKFDWESYSSALCGGSDHTMKKYCTNFNYGTVDNKTVLDPEDDAAHVNWQGAWRMPTNAELDALCDQCTWTWTKMINSAGKSINGYKVSSKTDSSKFIFLPAAVDRFAGYFLNPGLFGYYWSSSLYTSDSSRSYSLYFSSDYQNTSNSYRCIGRPVRPVCQ